MTFDLFQAARKGAAQHGAQSPRPPSRPPARERPYMLRADFQGMSAGMRRLCDRGCLSAQPTIERDGCHDDCDNHHAIGDNPVEHIAARERMRSVH